MLKIRLQRVGRKHEPVFRLVLTDSKNSTKSGKYKEVLGSYDVREGDSANFKADRIKHWMSYGAQVSGTVHNILVSKKIIDGKKINVLPLKKPIVKESTEKAPEAQVSKETAKEEATEKAVEDLVSEVAEESKEEITPEEIKAEEVVS